jgi:hypothetical protein
MGGRFCATGPTPGRAAAASAAGRGGSVYVRPSRSAGECLAQDVAGNRVERRNTFGGGKGR